MSGSYVQRVFRLALFAAVLLGGTGYVLALEDSEPDDDIAVVAGEDETSAADQAAADQAAADAMVAAAREEEIRLLRQTAATLEAELASLGDKNGLYDLSLAEIQTDLGRVYADLGEYDKAQDLLEQALHLVRLNSGLYDPQQIRVLEELVAALIARSEWDKVDDYQHLVFSLQKRTYAPESAEFTDAVLAMGNWQLALNDLGKIHGFQAMSQLSELKDMYAGQLVHARASEDLNRQWALVYNSALADLAMTRQYLRGDLAELMVNSQRYLNQTVCRNVPDGAGGYNRLCWQESVPNPDYHRRVHEQQRSQVNRARVSVNGTRSELQEMLDNNPGFAEAHAEEARIGLEQLDKALRDIDRDFRMSSMGFW